MINILFFLLLILYAASITYSIPGAVIFAFSILFFFLMYRSTKNKSKSKTTSLVQLMCYALPLSWRNIFGGEYADLPISWFYLIGVILAVHLLLIKKEVRLNRSLSKTSIIIFLILIFSIIPLLITNTAFMQQGISQFIILSFHHIIILIALLKGNIVSRENIFNIEKSYIKAGFITSLGIITQFILFKLGTTIGIIQLYNYRQAFNFLFADVSHATLYLATTAFLAFQLLSSVEKVNSVKYTLVPIIILIGAATTSARTGLVVFFAVFIFYILMGQKGLAKKIVTTLTGVLGFFGAMAIFQLVRPQDNVYKTLFDSSGRTDGYKTAIGLFLDNPLIGYGFSRDYISEIMGASVPHLSFLQYLMHGGIFYTVMIFGIIVFTYFYAKKYKMNESWLILLTLIGTCLIPDIFSTRYITLLMLIVFLKANNIKRKIYTTV